jgi:hypothetical protein
MSSSMPPGRGAGRQPNTRSALELSIWMLRISAGTIHTGTTSFCAASSIVRTVTGALCPRLAAIACRTQDAIRRWHFHAAEAHRLMTLRTSWPMRCTVHHRLGSILEQILQACNG